ncbi:hypothetical protein C7H79_08745 [Nitrosomonas supralitoralis]|uniref:Uncharacterized protein n=1 Tax=Nitrosomonas supralitoralis TaxID=2116706 RepID=A0A2P7NUX2_9PROT|nr:hypothetical protein C7H79_08745 [Nitrosomonas supralitoralis]
MQLGKVNTRVENTAGLFSRDSEKFQMNAALILNVAALMRDDTLILIPEINYGRFSFDVY